jgi:hypothetical protein
LLLEGDDVASSVLRHFGVDIPAIVQALRVNTK